jgi:hypothetical protein
MKMKKINSFLLHCKSISFVHLVKLIVVKLGDSVVNEGKIVLTDLNGSLVNPNT